MNVNIQSSLDAQRSLFDKGTTKSINFRLDYLRKLQHIILKKEEQICKALYNDLRKSEFEAKAAETQFILAELNLAIKNCKKWAKPKRVWPTLINFPSADYIYKEPYGQVLIIAPWNYPFQLAISPLIGAIAAGNTAVIKPSELTPNTSRIISEIISDVFPEDYVKVFEGGVPVSQSLLKEKWDYIFFTGSVQVGKIVYQAAAEHLTPVTLELGGKNPCIIDETASIDLAAKRIVWGKFLNSGQTCIAPDYILIHDSKKQAFIEAIKKSVVEAYGENPEVSSDYPRIVNEDHFNRLKKLLEGQNIVYGGHFNAEDKYIAPTILDEPDLKSEVMEGEIFGPILPVIGYDSLEKANSIISSYEKPLSLYVFSNHRKNIDYLVKRFSFGNGAVNDTVIQIINKRLPFGGVGHSGIGSYHGKKTFDIFSHHKSVVKRTNWIDIPLRYAPYKSKMRMVNYLKHLF
ncbi:aldehyde dehydrogenase [Flavobacteriaceae bacterium M23B6Z8]